MKSTRLFAYGRVLALSQLLIFAAAQNARAGSATWNLNPTSGDWNTATNWMPNVVPDGPSDVASFAPSNTTEVSLSAESTEVAEIVFNPGASAFNITAGRFDRGSHDQRRWSGE